MNKVPRNLAASRPIDLGAEADFSLSGLSVRPSLREAGTDGIYETVEPRVLQVLVALVRAEGSVVSRDRLIEQCWGGRLVGDDAINSSIAKVRSLAALTTPAAFEIETVPRVGYRLHAREAATLTAPATVEAPEVPSPEKRHRLPRRAAAWAAVALAIVAVLFAALPFLRSSFVPRQREWVIAESRMSFINTPLVERAPTFSPDGAMIAYTAGTELKDRRIYLRLRNGGDPIVLTRDVMGALSPSWSPDGNSIAYLRYEQGEPCRIMLIAVPAGTSRQVGQCRGSIFSRLVWDRAGTALFFYDSDAPGRPQHIFRLDLETGNVAELKRNAPAEANDMARSVSQDNKTLLILRSIGNDFTQVVLHTLADGHERIFLISRTFEPDAIFSADDGTVFVTQTLAWESSLWAYPLAGGAPQRILTSAASMDQMTSAPGGLLALDLEELLSQLAGAVSSPDKPADVLDRQGFAYPDYAPDGTLAALAWKSGGLFLWIAEPGKPAHPLLRLNGCACELRWSPDGNKLAYFLSVGAQYRVFVINRAGMPLAQFDSPLPIRAVDWGADGKSVLTTRQDEKGWRIWRTDLAKPDKSVPISGYGWSYIRVRGNRIFGVKGGNSEIWRIDGTPRPLTRKLDDTMESFWTVVKDRILYPDFSDPAHPRIMAVPLEGGEPVVAGYAPDLGHNTNFAANPASGRITYARLVSETADIGWIRLSER